MAELSVTVVGLAYRVTPTTMKKLQKELEKGPISATLEREPRNQADEHAIKVVLQPDDWHIGYLTREVASMLAPRLDRQRLKIRRARVTSVDPERSTAELEIQTSKVKMA